MRASWILAVAWALAAGAGAAAEPVPEGASPGFKADHGPGYAPSTWPTVHGDSRNSDHVPLVTTTRLDPAWRALEGAAIWTAPSVGADGTLYVTTGRGAGTSHLHALAPDGSVRWESPRYVSGSGVDAGAITSAPVLDADGDVYVGDDDELWAFHADGRLKWSVDVVALGARGPFVTAFLRGPHVGAVSIHGDLLLLERESGALAAPVFALPGGPSPEGPPLPAWNWDGLMDEATRQRTNDVLMGYRYEVTNTPALDPRSGRLFLLAGGRTLEEGLFYGIDLVDGAWRIAFETPVDAGTGTSPAISPDGRLVYAFDGDGGVIAFDARSGKPVFERAIGGVPASPSVGPDGAVYALARERLVKLDGATGELLWERTYHEFAQGRLPWFSRFRPLLTTGRPVASIDSVVTIAANVVWTSLALGYEISVFGRELIHQRRTFLVALAPETGKLLAAYSIPDTSEGGISMGPEGQLYLDLLATQASLAAGAPYAWLLPQAARTPRPRAGLVAFEPRSQREQAALGLERVASLLEHPALPASPDRVLEARSQLASSLRSLDLARLRGEPGPVDDSEARAAGDAFDRCLARSPAPCPELAGYGAGLASLARALGLPPAPTRAARD